MPLRRVGCADRILRSLALGRMPPHRVLLVSNELDHVEPHGLDVQVIRFWSRRYAVGHCDVVLRRNVGLWAASAPGVLFFDDDQIAPVDLVEATSALLESRPYVCGNYRYLDTEAHPVEQLVHLPASEGRAKETPHRWHGWQSCAGGLVAVRRDALIRLGGFDMIYGGWKHAMEDQNLGRRLSHHLDGGRRVWIHEPPFAWHPPHHVAWTAAPATNLCPSGAHRYVADTLHRPRGRPVPLLRCQRCPHMRPRIRVAPLLEPVVAFDPQKVDVQLLPAGRQATG